MYITKLKKKLVGVGMFKKKTVSINRDKNPIVAELFNEIYLNNGLAVFEYKGKKDKWIKASSKIGIISKKIGKDFLYPPSTNRVNQIGFVNIPPKVEINKKECNGNILKFELKKLF